MKLLTIITLATAACAAVGDQYKLRYKKKGVDANNDSQFYPLAVLDGTLVTAGFEGETITVTEQADGVFTVGPNPIVEQYMGNLANLAVLDPSRTAAKFNVANGVLSLADGYELYYCTGLQDKSGPINVRNNLEVSRCRFRITIDLVAQKI